MSEGDMDDKPFCLDHDDKMPARIWATAFATAWSELEISIRLSTNEDVAEEQLRQLRATAVRHADSAVRAYHKAIQEALNRQGDEQTG